MNCRTALLVALAVAIVLVVGFDVAFRYSDLCHDLAANTSTPRCFG